MKESGGLEDVPQDILQRLTNTVMQNFEDLSGKIDRLSAQVNAHPCSREASEVTARAQMSATRRQRTLRLPVRRDPLRNEIHVGYFFYI